MKDMCDISPPIFGLQVSVDSYCDDVMLEFYLVFKCGPFYLNDLASRPLIFASQKYGTPGTPRLSW